MKKKYWIVKLGLTLGLLVLADYDIGAMMYIMQSQYGFSWTIL